MLTPSYGLPNMIALSLKGATELASKLETGMGYQAVTIVPKDGGKFDQVAVGEGRITEIRRLKKYRLRKNRLQKS
jgi:hypothetical protein